MSKTSLFLIPVMLVFAGALSSAAVAGGISTGTLAVEDAAEYARTHNPEILAAKEKWLAAKENVTAVRFPMDPQLSYENDKAVNMNIYGISQEVPFPGKLFLRSKEARNAAEAVYQSAYLSKEREITARVKESYFILLVAERSVEIYRDNAGIMRNFIKSAEAKYSVGRAGQGDVLRAQVELSKMVNMADIMEQECESARVMLNVLLDRKPDEPLGSPREPEKYSFGSTLGEIEKAALENRPELIGAKKEIEKSKRSLTLAKTEYLPDFMLSYKKQVMQDTGAPAGDAAMLSLNFPLWFWKQRAMVRGASSELGMAQKEYAAMENITRYDARNLFTKVRVYTDLINRYRDVILPQARQNFDVSEAAYRSDKSDFLELLDSQRTLLELKLEYYKYVGEYGRYLSELERITGKELNRGGQ
jgi:outer membrane protein TolC